MKTLFTTFILISILTSGYAQQYDMYPSPGFICSYLLIGDFNCSNCSYADVNLPYDLQEDVSEVTAKYIHCNVIQRGNIAEILSLADNEHAIVSLDELSSTQIENIRTTTEAQRVLFGNLRMQGNNHSLLVTLEIVNLNTTDLEAKVRFEIPKGKQYVYSERIPYVEDGLSRLFLGEGLPDGSIGEDSKGSSVTPDTVDRPSTSPIVFHKYSLATDPGGTQYETIKINGQEWLASNLQYNVSNSWCYNNNTGYCRNYGRLYSWEAARNACAKLGAGWRLPTLEEWQNLALSLDGYFMIQPDFKFKLIGSNPTLTYEKLLAGGTSLFEAKLAGRRDELGNFNEFGNVGFFWTSTPFDANLSWAWLLMRVNPMDGVVVNSTGPLPWPKNNRYSCRCIKDIE